VQRVAPAGEKPQNRPLSKLNTGRFALRAMLPVIKNNSINQRLLLYVAIKFCWVGQVTKNDWPIYTWRGQKSPNGENLTWCK